MSVRTVHTCDRCQEDFEPSVSTTVKAQKGGTVSVVLIRVGRVRETIDDLAANPQRAVKDLADLCWPCSDALRNFLAGTPVMGETRGDA